MYDDNFDGTFKFTNATDEDFVFLWNNKEYVFEKGTCSPIIIADESLENIQEIRKKAAYKLATREFYKGKQYRSMSKMGRGTPPTFDDKVLQPWIDECLKPLPVSKVKVNARKGKNEETKFTSKAVSQNDNVNEVFKDQEIKSVGKMPDAPMN